MAVSNRFAIQRVFDIYLFDLTDGSSKGRMNKLKETNFTNEQTTVYADGGAGNPHIVGFDHSKMARIEASDAIYNLPTMGVQLGTTPVTGANTDFVYEDKIYVATNAALTTYTALGTVGSEIKFVYELNTDGSLGTSYTQGAVVSSGVFTYTPGTKTITFDAAEIADDTQIIVYYNCTTDVTAKTLTNYTNVFSEHVKMVANGLVKDICTKEDYLCEIIFYNAKVSGNFDMALAADGEVATQNISFEALSSCSSDKLWDIIIADTLT